MAAAWLCRAPRPAHVFFTLLTPSIQITFLREAAFLRLATAVKRRLSFSAHFCSHSEKGAMPWAGKREEGDTVQRKRGGRCLAGPCNLAQKGRARSFCRGPAFCRLCRAHRRKSVSYTHLDVYKRQGYMCGFAYAISLLVYQFGGLVTGEVAFGLGLSLIHI